jgi:hypothetical protein
MFARVHGVDDGRCDADWLEVVMEQREITMIRELCELEDGLKDREVEFVEDLSHKSSSYKLTERQLEWLEAIWNRECVKKCR